MSDKYFGYICEQNSSSKCLAQSERRDCGTHMAAEPACGTYKAHILRSFHTFDLKSHRKNSFYKKTSSINEKRLNA